MAALAPSMLPIAVLILLMTAVESDVALEMRSMRRAMSSAASEVLRASALTSCATIANPAPASPARAASIVALSASRLVCAATSAMVLTTEEICSAASLRAATVDPAC